MNRCPTRAIEAAHGFIAVFLFVFDVALLALIYPAVRPIASALSDTGVVGTLARFVFEAALMLVALFLSYRLLHRALRFRLVERLVVVTSLTHLRFWRRYRPPNQFAGPDRIRGGTQS